VDGEQVPSTGAAEIRWLVQTLASGVADDQGSDFAFRRLHEAFEKGLVPADTLGQALGWLRDAAESRSSASAAFFLARAFARGWGGPRNLRQAARWLRKAADWGSDAGAYGLAFLYLDGWGVGRDEAEAVRWMRRAAELGSPDAQAFLGCLCRHGYCVPKDAAAAAAWREKAEDLGEPRADDGYAFVGLPSPRRWGDDLLGSPFSDHEDPEARRLLRLEAVLGVPMSQVALAVRKINGWGGPPDPVEAAYWLRAAAEEGESGAQVRLGVLYEAGVGVPRDAATAAVWYEAAARNRNEWAAALLGSLYSRGEGVPRDLVLAARWYRQGAEGQACRAMTALGVMHAWGTGVERDPAEALRWLNGAAEDGDPEALYWLGALYATGTGVDRDLKTAAACVEGAIAGTVGFFAPLQCEGEKWMRDWETGCLAFSDWSPGFAAPRAGVYAVLDLRADPPDLVHFAAAPNLRERLELHARGERGDDPFATLVADRLLLPTLTRAQVADVAAGRRSIDDLTRAFIHRHLAFVWCDTATAGHARAVERRVNRKGIPGLGKPLFGRADAPNVVPFTAGRRPDAR
jgi:hypothetical protein